MRNTLKTVSAVTLFLFSSMTFASKQGNYVLINGGLPLQGTGTNCSIKVRIANDDGQSAEYTIKPGESVRPDPLFNLYRIKIKQISAFDCSVGKPFSVDPNGENADRISWSMKDGAENAAIFTAHSDTKVITMINPSMRNQAAQSQN